MFYAATPQHASTIKAASVPACCVIDTRTIAVIEALMSLSTLTTQLGFSTLPGVVNGSFSSLQPERETAIAKRQKTATLKEQSPLEFLTCDIISFIVSDYYYFIVFDDLIYAGFIGFSEHYRCLDRSVVAVGLIAYRLLAVGH